MLAYSYNVATVRLGLEISMEKIVATIKDLGIDRPFPAHPSLLAGAINMTPLEVAYMYQTIAAGGFKIPIRTIKSITNASGEQINSYPSKVISALPSSAVFQLKISLQKVITDGTGRSMARFLPREYQIAGITGTTKNLTDSWFTGFTGNYLGVVWIGNDQGTSIRLTGSRGALPVWGKLMQRIDPTALKLTPEDHWGIKFHWVNPKNGLITSKQCSGAVYLPFKKDKVPPKESSCSH